MQTLAGALLILLAGAASGHPSNPDQPVFAPALFQDVLLAQSQNNDTTKASITKAPNANSFDLFARQQGNCPNSYNTCTTNGAACCGTASYCSNDANGNLACCKIGATCTGAANYAVATAEVTTLTSTNGGFVVIITTTLAVTSFIGAATTTSASYISNSLFPLFPFYGTSFPNSAACVSAYSSCSSVFTVCTNDLQGTVGGFGVTISAPGGGVTVGQASTTVASAVASSVCAGLSEVACPGGSSTCGIFTGTATAGGTFIVGAGNSGARVTGVPGIGWAMGAAVVGGLVL